MSDEAPLPTPPPKPQEKQKLGPRLKALLAEYGKLALWIYFIIFALVFAGFFVAIASGIEVESAAGNAGLVGAAWLATKVTQPVRILVTLGLTPIVARVLKRDRGIIAP